MMEKYSNKNIHIVGITGAEGSEIALFLSKNIDAKFTFHDIVSSVNLKENLRSYHESFSEEEIDQRYSELQEIDAQWKLEAKYLDGIEEADIIFVPQSWFRYKENALLEFEKEKLQNIIHLYLDSAKCQVIGVTGTVGKSTTTAMIYEIMKQTGRNVVLSGNDRKVKQHLFEVEKFAADDVLILEISNRHLSFPLEKSPNVAIITEIAPNHLDDHGTFEEYIETKKKIFAYQGDSDLLIINADNEFTKDLKGNGATQYFSTKNSLEYGAYLENESLVIQDGTNKEQIVNLNEVAFFGEHNIKNALAATLAAKSVGATIENIQKGLKAFRSLKGRLQFVKEVEGITFINDNKSSNPAAVAAAVQAFKQPVVLIAGGMRKNIEENEFQDLAKTILKSSVKGLQLMGDTGSTIKEAVEAEAKRQGVEPPTMYTYDNFKDTFKNAVVMAERGEVVLLSPGAESFGMFKDYRDRENRYLEMVSKLTW